MFDEPSSTACADCGNSLFSNAGNGATEGDAGNAYPAGVYTHNLTSILNDNSSTFTPIPVQFTISGLPATGYYQLMQKSSGTYELVLWGEAFASQTTTPVIVSLGSAYPVINVYDITGGSAPLNSYSNAGSVTVNLSDHVVIVEFSGATTKPSPTSTITPIATPSFTAIPTSSATVVPTLIATAIPTPMPTASPTEIAVPTAGPTAIGIFVTADPNADQTTKNVLAYLYGLMGSGSTHHLIQSNQDVAVFCTAAYGPGSCPSQDATNFAANGNQYAGAIGVDPCNGYWADFGGSYDWLANSMCQTGASSDTETVATDAWDNGQLVVMSIEMTNPYNNWQNLPPGSAQGIACAGENSYIAEGAGIDCSGITAAFATNMLTPGTIENTHWLAELAPYAQMMLRLQADGVTVIYRVFQEIDTPNLWWGDFPSNLHAPLITSIEHYFESQGVHNVLYEYAIIDGGSTSDYPGNANVDLLGTDVYESVPGSGVTPGYAALSALGSGKPITFGEYNCSTGLGSAQCSSTYNFDSIDQAAKASMPNLVLVNYWLGPNPGNETYQPSFGVNPNWQGYMQDPYNVMEQDVPSFK